ncbi:MAG TPA: PLP-dependent aminotransferase family protein [Thermoprotei archaeon]|nr:PLP-dependent aminotransferase family protein [Thermoprotei archaeon]
MREIHFTGGKTPPETFPYNELINAAERVIKELKDVFAYYPTQHKYADYSLKGYRPLREIASKRYWNREGVELPVDNIVITAGSMQAIELVGRTFIKPGDTVITEELTYYGTLEFFRYLGARIIGVKIDEKEGIIVDDLEEKLRILDSVGVKPKFIYVLPNNHNPTGARMPESNRIRLIDITKEYNIPIIEDDCYGDLDFIRDTKPKSILTLDKNRETIFIATFSKIIAPALRLGYFYAHEKYLNSILSHRWDIGTSLLASAIVAEYLKDNLWRQIERQIEAIKLRRDILLESLEEYMSKYATWTKPDGGLFIWVKLNVDVDMNRLEKKASEYGVYFDSGWKFHYRMKKLKAFRLSYAHVPPDEIREGVKRISNAVKDILKT